jgi:hypothetical protein
LPETALTEALNTTSFILIMAVKNRKYAEGHFVGMWMAICIVIFSGIGVPLFIALENPGLIGIGPAIGVALGLSIGSGIESRYKKEGKIRPLTGEEKKKREMLVAAGVAILAILSVMGLVVFLLLV